MNLIKISQKVNKIQNFMKPILAKIRNDKNKKFFIDGAKKIINKNLVNIGKINKLNKNIKKIFFDKLIKDINNYNNNNKKRNGIINGSNKINEKIKNLMTKNFIKKWKYKNKDNYKKNNKAALLIQKLFKGYQARKEKNRLLNIKKAMLNLFNKKDKLANNKLCSVLRKWNSLAKLLNYNDKAIKIQKQWNKYQDKLNKDKDLANKLKIQRGLEKLINNKFGGKYAINKIKEEANRNKFNKFINVLINNRKNKLKDSLDKIKKQAFDNTLKKALEVQPDRKCVV